MDDQDNSPVPEDPTWAEAPKPEAVISPGDQTNARVPPPPVRDRRWHHTDLAAASELLAKYGETFRYNYDRGSYLVYVEEEGRWDVDHTGHVRRCVHKMGRDAWRAVQVVKTRAQLSYAKRLTSHAGTEAIVAKARFLLGVSVGNKHLDADPWSLNTIRGVVDLRTGEVGPHDSALLLSKLAPVQYDPRAQCPKWLNFLTEITEADESLMIYLQRLAGHWLTADVSVQEFWIFHGGGDNGKSVFLDTVKGIMGDYAVTAPESLVTANQHGSHSTDIAMLCGTRLAVASETEAGVPLRMQLIKRLTGDAGLQARFMRMDNFEFPRTNKTVIVTNNRPVLTEISGAVRRRVRLVPFSFIVPPERKNTNLLAELREEWPGILAWAVRGCIEWQADGLAAPQSVTQASENYMAEQDDVADWIEARCSLGAGNWGTREELYSSYCSWAGHGNLKLSKLTFYERLRRYPDVEDLRKSVAGEPRRGFQGIRLSTPEPFAERAQDGEMF